MNKRYVLLNLLIVLLVTNGLVWQKEKILRSAQSVLLPLAPRDPRSLMQGDYMVLRYKMAQKVDNQRGTATDGFAVIKLNENNVGTFVDLWLGRKLGPKEQLLRYRYRNGQVRFGAESFFFQEGKGKLFERARYGELRVEESGDAILVGLRDDKLNKLGH